MTNSKSNTDIFFWPILIGFMTTIGLMSALIGDGIYDALSWVLLSVPVAIAIFHSRR